MYSNDYFKKCVKVESKRGLVLLAPLLPVLRDQFYWKKGDKLAIKVNPKTGEVTSIKKVKA